MASNVYKKLTPIEHILFRPEMYIGDTSRVSREEWVYSNGSLEKKTVEYRDAVLKLFDEVYTNAIDQYSRNKGVTAVSVKISSDKPHFTVKNNGEGVKIYKTEYGIWSPELIFGNLLTSGNYNDDRENVVGLNGLGVKLTNIFSKRFRLTTVYNGKKYYQEFENNMKVIKPPVISDTNSKDYTEISVLLDSKVFPDLQWGNYIPLFITRCYYTNSIATTPIIVEVKVDNDTLFKEKYTNTYFLKNCKDCIDTVSIKDYKIGFTTGDTLEFINGIHTRESGYFTNKVYNYLYKLLETGIKNKVFTLAFLKKNIGLYMSIFVKNPVFSNQSKHKCTGGETGPLEFKLKASSRKKILDILKKAIADKEMSQLTKDTDGKKKKVVSGIPNLDDAKFAGTKKSTDCTLFLTEGLSAKTFAVSGISSMENGRDYNGIFPLKGKLLNVRQSSIKKISENEEIKSIKKILGLENNKVYKKKEDLESLRYSKVYILADADADAYHISGLVINFFHYFWPNLLYLDFISIVRTPLVKVKVSKDNTIEFYTEKEYYEWEKRYNGKVLSRKYYKGLGSSTNKEAIEVFKQLEKNTRKLEYSKECSKAIELAFKKENNRKDWVKVINIENPGKPDTYCNFINVDLRSFSIYDNVRSIPSIEDGLKISQRKVLWTLYTKKYPGEIKVAQLGAATAELTDYHHGEASLYSTIVTLAQDYRGSNNYPLLEACGNFGTHLENGDDSASPRYIFTKLTQFCRDNISEDDLKYLQPNYSSPGCQIEPKVMYSKLPLVLVNGAKGIGTGFSTDIPMYCIEDIKKEIEYILNNTKTSNNIIKPFYRGFKGRLKDIKTSKEGNTFIYECQWERKGNSIHIHCLPIGRSVSQYKTFLETKGFQYENRSSDIDAYFIVNYTGDNVVNDLGLEWSKRETNMNIWVDDKIVQFRDPKSIIKKWLGKRLEFLKKKRDIYIKNTLDDISYLEVKMDYISRYISGSIPITNLTTQKLRENLQNLYSKDEYVDKLLDIKLTSLTKDNMEKLANQCKDKKKSIQYYKALDMKGLFRQM